MATTVVNPEPTQTAPQTPQMTVSPAQPETVEQKYKRLYEATQQAPQAVQPSVAQPQASELTTLLQTVEGLKGELTSLRTALPPPQVVTQPAPTPWYEMLRQGDFEGAENNLLERIKGKVLQEAKQTVSAEANESLRVQLEVNDFLQTLRTQNPELATMEKYLQAPVGQIIEQARTDGKIKSTNDFLRIYKEAVNTEFTNMRNVFGQQRAAGQQQAQTRQQEVLSSTPLVPQSVRSVPDGSTNATPPTETLDDYFTRRKALESLRKGMTVQG